MPLPFAFPPLKLPEEWPKSPTGINEAANGEPSWQLISPAPTQPEGFWPRQVGFMADLATTLGTGKQAFMEKLVEPRGLKETFVDPALTAIQAGPEAVAEFKKGLMWGGEDPLFGEGKIFGREGPFYQLGEGIVGIGERGTNILRWPFEQYEYWKGKFEGGTEQVMDWAAYFENMLDSLRGTGGEFLETITHVTERVRLPQLPETILDIHMPSFEMPSIGMPSISVGGARGGVDWTTLAIIGLIGLVVVMS